AVHDGERPAGFGDAAWDRPVGLLLCDPQDRILEVNRALCDIVGRAPATLVGRRHADLLHPADRGTARRDLADLLAGRWRRCVSEHRYVRADGGVRWVSANSSLFSGARPADQPRLPL